MEQLVYLKSAKLFPDQVELLYKTEYPDSDYKEISSRYRKLFVRAERSKETVSNVVKIIYLMFAH